jgi:hypothetical protein
MAPRAVSSPAIEATTGMNGGDTTAANSGDHAEVMA